MGEGPQILTFLHRFKSEALCKLTVDLATVKAAWTLSVFADVANRAQASVLFSFWHRPGRSETWECRPGERPLRIKREDEPCRNLASAIMATAIGRVAVQRRAEAEQC